MASLVPKTALPGRSRSMHDETARGLGYFSIALGIAEIACRARSAALPASRLRTRWCAAMGCARSRPASQS